MAKTIAIDLQAGETILSEMSGDYWEKLFLCLYDQKRGHIWITNQRIIFRGGLIAALDLDMKEIDSVSTCNVGPFIPFLPTGVKVTMKDGKVYKLSVMGRAKAVEAIQQQIR